MEFKCQNVILIGMSQNLDLERRERESAKKSLDPLAQSLGSSVNSALATKSIFQKTGRVDRGLGGVPTWYGSPTQ